MNAKKKFVSPFANTERLGDQPANRGGFCLCASHALLLLGIAMVLIIAPSEKIRAADQPDLSRTAQLDSRWLPWIGSWSLISNAPAGTESNGRKNFTLEIEPGDERRSVAMKGFQDEKLLIDKQITVDGSRQALKEEDCEGWYTYTWSETGKRLVFESELACPDDRSRTISGISFFVNPIEWVDIQLVTSGEDRAITIRRYREAAGGQITPGTGSTSQLARSTAGSNFSIEEVVELNDIVAPQVMEAALVEMHQPFDINSETLVRLADAGVPSQVVDLIVALSFPEKFTVERDVSEPVQRAYTRQPDANVVYCNACAPFGVWSFYDPFFPWYWGSPGWFYSYWGWGGWGYYPPIWGTPGYGGGYRISGGRLIEGKGYAKVSPGGSNSDRRYAQPRNNSAGRTSRAYRSNTGNAANTASRSSGSTGSRSLSNPAYTPPSRGGISRGSGGGGYSGGGSPRASPGGYGGGGGGQAHRRD